MKNQFWAVTLCSNGFYADIWNHVWSQNYKFLVVLKYHRRPWVNVFDTDISRCVNTYIKVVYMAFFGTFMFLKMSVSKILAQGRLWCFKTTKRSIFQTFWKPDFGARFLFIELDTSNFGYCLFFNFAELCKVWEWLDNIYLNYYFSYDVCGCFRLSVFLQKKFFV